VHAASVGETNAVLPLLTRLRAARRGLSILLTTGTRTSASVAAERLPSGAMHQFVPLDVPAFVTRFLDHWRPDLAIFTESEIWPNLVTQTAARETPLVLVNARMSRRSYQRWRRRPGMAGALFGCFDLVLTQNQKFARWFAELGAARVEVAGNLKVDAPPPPVDEAERALLARAIGTRAVLVAASTHDGEEQMLATAHQQLRQVMPDLLTILAPRHPERGEAVAALMTRFGLRTVQRSRGALPFPETDIYIADTLGELGTLYSLAPVAFVGGSLVDKGGQNPIEAVRHGAVVLTGTYWHNFKDAYATLLRSGAALEVRSGAELASVAGRILADPAELARMRSRASQALSSLSGALERTLDAVMPLLPRAREFADAAS
jgi:3-deoxy-D-manno-octulosonic-acid transferase